METYWDEIFELERRVGEGDEKILIALVVFLKKKGLLNKNMMYNLIESSILKRTEMWNALHEFAKEYKV